MQRDLMLADRTQRTVRQPNLATLDLDSLPADGFRDVDRADGAEKLAFGAGLHLHLDHQALELLGATLRDRQLRGGFRLELGAARLESGLVFGRRERRLALWNQEIAGVARLHANQIADAAHVVDFLKQYDFHL